MSVCPTYTISHWLLAIPTSDLSGYSSKSISSITIICIYICVYIYVYVYIYTSPLISLQFPMFPHCISPHFISSLCHKIRSSCCKLRLHEGAPCAEAIPWELGECHGSGESSYGGFILWMEEILHHQTDG